MKSSKPAAPEYLSDAAKVWWKRLNERYEFGPDALLILESGLQSFDRWMEAKAAVDKDGITVSDRFGQVKQHPATLVERDSKLAMARAFKQLGIDSDPQPIKDTEDKWARLARR